jgi:chitin disaccharide deacetylase
MGCTDLGDSVRLMTKRLAREYNLDIDLVRHNVKGARYDGPSKTFAEKKASFMKMLRKLEKGNTYLFVDHPGLDNDELRAIHHVGYESVAEDRQGVTAIWTDPDIKNLIRDLGIQLISYKDLAKQ